MLLCMPEFYNSDFKFFNTIFCVLSLLYFISCEYKSAKNPDHIPYVDSIREKANRMVDNGDYKQAMTFFDSAYQVIPNPGIGDEIRKYSFRGQNYYVKLEDYNTAIANLDSIFLILNSKDLKNEYKRDYSTALFQKGDLLFKLNKYSEAYRHYYNGKLIAETILDLCAISEFTYRLGMVSYKQGKYQVAASNFKQCFNDVDYCVKDFRIYAFQQELLANISLSYSKCGMIDSSIIYSNKALVYIKNNEKKFPDRRNYSKMARGVIYGNQAVQYLVKGDTAFAETLLKKSFEINSKKGFDNNDAQLTLLKLGQLYVRSNRLNEAFETAEMLKVSLDSVYNLTVDIGLNEINWKYYDRSGQTDKAYIHLQNFVRLKDSLDKGNKELVIADVDKEFQSIEQQYKYTLLSKDNELKKIWLYVAILFSFMAMVILFLLWKNSKASKKNISALILLNKQSTFQNEQLEHTIEDLKQSSNDKDKILKVVAHDLRNPVGAIANISSILLDEIEFSSEHRKLMEAVKESSWQSISMINDLLTANTNQSSNLRMELINVSDLILKSVDQLGFKAKEKRQLIKLDIISDIKINADQEKLSRVISNLITNAIKFSPVDTEIKIRMERKAGILELIVEDNGIGISPLLSVNVFEMFSSAKRQGTAGEQSFGIGLSFSKQIVEAHKGKIWFESEVNKGTIFYIQLPIDEPLTS